jgi:hypothetical protein
METEGATIEDCMLRHPETAGDLRDSIGIWDALEIAPRHEPTPAGQHRGLERLLAALDGARDGKRRIGRMTLVQAMTRAGVVAAAALAILSTLGGASAALGGPDVFDEVLSGIGASNASDTGKEHANPNALEGADNAGQGIENASDTGKEHANPNVLEGSDNAGQGIENASGAGKEHANPNALEGSGNAGQDLDNAPDDAGAPDACGPDPTLGPDLRP